MGSAALIATELAPPVGRTTNIRVSFLPDGEQTLMVLEHSGWERLSDPAAAA